jgi:tRNA-Thr(GGU) m(6)t(6)A37 methyltransferase TsaA
MKFEITPVAVTHSCYKEKFATPRQSGLAPSAVGKIQLLPPFDDPDTLLGLEDCSHIWLEFIFHECIKQGWKPKVRPPRLGGNKKMGVFATRATHRPNGLGLSVVKLERIEKSNQGLFLHVSGLDLIDGTPIVDIKPYIPYSDSIQDAQYPFAQHQPAQVTVNFSDEALQQLQDSQLQNLINEILAQDPRPAFHEVDESRIYGAHIHDRNVKWHYKEVEGEVEIIVVSVKTVEEGL